ncbi:hypothetical protein PAMA_014228 [Pampus argenteus]
MGRIIFYEERNFQGRSYETNNDCAELTSYLSKCNSCRVESGLFMVYEKPNFMGHQMLVKRGEYPDNQRLMGMSVSDCIRSARMIPVHRGPFRMRLYEKENFGGQMHELMDDCDNMMERFRMSECQSCNVMDGHWLMFEQPNFRGKMLYLRQGEYRNLREMGMSNVSRFSSIRRIVDSSCWDRTSKARRRRRHTTRTLGSGVTSAPGKVFEGVWIFYEYPVFLCPAIKKRMNIKSAFLINILNVQSLPADTQIRIYERPDDGVQRGHAQPAGPLASTVTFTQLISRTPPGSSMSIRTTGGRQYLLVKGEYRQHAEWGALHPSVGSIRRVMDY